MFKFSHAALGGAFALAGVLAVSAPAAATTVQIDPGSPVDGITWSIVPAAGLLHSAFYNANVTPQSPASIGSAVGGWFGVTLTNIAGGNLENLSGKTLSYDGPAANVFAIHIGQGEFAFYFSAAITDFTFTENGKGLSNLRAYCSLASCEPDNAPPPGSTPVPGAAWLMGSVVGLGLGAAQLRRRRRVKAA